ncbi:MAG: hypothetical protein NZ455_00940 [Bacteroidia bacterium]|nr:hypothetical protein [Bacteroidia bacterium]
MREACGGRASARCEALCTTLILLPRGWGVAPLARSTPTRAQARDTPKIKPSKNNTTPSKYQPTRLISDFSDTILR